MESQGISHPGEGFMVGLPARFVILHHTGVDVPHYDFLLDIAGREKLPTWRIEAAPETWSDEPPLAEKIGDHRRHYLTYEGPIDGNRGEVRRVAEGYARILKVTPEFLRLYLAEPFSLTLDFLLVSIA